MRHQLAKLCLLGLSACNSLFGTAGAVVLCLHSYGSGHILSDSTIEACCHDIDLDHGYPDTGVLTSECTQCTDIVLWDSPVPLPQQPENSTVKAPSVALSKEWLPHAIYGQRLERDSLLGSRHSSEITPLGVTLKQTVVWLL